VIQPPAEHLVQIGMRAAVRDVIDYVQSTSWHDSGVDRADNESNLVLDAQRLNAYLLALLITAGAYEDLNDGEG
jgi:hypothetical protein